MFFHNFKYSLKTLLRNKSLIFWTFAFPLILGTLFYMTFSDISSKEKLNVIDIAIIDNEEFKNNNMLKYSFDVLSEDGSENQMFNTKYTDKDEANKLIEEDKIVGYLLIEENTPKIIVNKSGINQTIFKYVTEEVFQKGKMLENLDYSAMNQNIQEIMSSETVNLNNVTNDNLDYIMIEFYTLIAMACMYGSLFGMTSINYKMANISSVGKRVAISPTKKGTTILSSLMASFLLQLIGIVILFLYTIFVLHVDYGSHIEFVVLLAFVGSLAGQVLGVFVGSVFKVGENSKIGILIGIIMSCCFLAGMMGVMMKYVIDTNIPIINKLNPVNMITDGFYALYYYNTFDRYWFNIISLAIYSLILTTISFFVIRRQKYDSI